MSSKRHINKAALKVHPDKNKSPLADEAFKKLNKALQYLGKPYSAQYAQDAKHNRNSKNGRNPQEEQDSDDMFYSFFGNQSKKRDEHHDNETKIVLLQILPIIILLIIYLLYQLIYLDDRVYSFQQDEKFHIPVETDTHHIKYYISKETYSQVAYNSRKLMQLEAQIEQDAYDLFVQQCQESKQNRKDILSNAAYYEDYSQTDFEYYLDQLDRQAEKEGFTSWKQKRKMEETEKKR